MPVIAARHGRVSAVGFVHHHLRLVLEERGEAEIGDLDPAVLRRPRQTRVETAAEAGAAGKPLHQVAETLDPVTDAAQLCADHRDHAPSRAPHLDIIGISWNT